LKDALKKAKIEPGKVEEVIWKCPFCRHEQNVPRQAAIAAGFQMIPLPYSVNKVCGSGLKSVALGCTIDNAR